MRPLQRGGLHVAAILLSAFASALVFALGRQQFEVTRRTKALVTASGIDEQRIAFDALCRLEPRALRYQQDAIYSALDGFFGSLEQHRVDCSEAAEKASAMFAQFALHDSRRVTAARAYAHLAPQIYHALLRVGVVSPEPRQATIVSIASAEKYWVPRILNFAWGTAEFRTHVESCLMFKDFEGGAFFSLEAQDAGIDLGDLPLERATAPPEADVRWIRSKAPEAKTVEISALPDHCYVFHVLGKATDLLVAVRIAEIHGCQVAFFWRVIEARRLTCEW